MKCTYCNHISNTDTHKKCPSCGLVFIASIPLNQQKNIKNLMKKKQLLDSMTDHKNN